MSITRRGGLSARKCCARQRRVGLDRHARVVGRRPDAHRDDAGAEGELARAEQQHERAHRPQRGASRRRDVIGSSSTAARACSASMRTSRRSSSRGVDRRCAGRARAAGRAAFSGHSASFRPGRGEDVAKAGVFPFLRVVEAVEVEVRGVGRPRQLVGLHHRVGRALDAALHAERAQQVAHEGGLAGAERAVQLDEGVAQRRARAASARGGGGAGGLVGPGEACGFLESADDRCCSSVDGATSLLAQLREWAAALGFSQIGVADVDLSRAEPGCWRGCTTAFTARWTTWPRTA